MKLQSNYKYETVVAHLKKAIAENAGNANYKFPTESALCEQFGISRVSVRKALKILENEGLIIRKQGSGTTVSPDVSKEFREEFSKNRPDKRLLKVGIVIPELASDYTLSLLNSIQNWAESHGYTDVVFEYGISRHNPETESRTISNMIESGVNGLLVFPIDGQYYSKKLIELSLSRFPIVVIDRILPGLDFTFVTGANKRSFAHAVRMIHERGHEKIAYFSATPQPTSAAKERLAGYEEGLKSVGIKIDATYEIIADRIRTQNPTEEEIRQNYLSSTARMRKLLITEKVDAILCDCTTSSILIMRLMRSEDAALRQIAKRVSVLYCDMDFSVLSNASPAPSCILNDYVGIGEKSIELLFERMLNEETERKTVKIPFRYVKGETLF